MYLAAALCMLALRAWKIKELEQIAVQKGEPIKSVDVVREPKHDSTNAEVDILKASTMKRLWVWRKV